MRVLIRIVASDTAPPYLIMRAYFPFIGANPPRLQAIDNIAKLEVGMVSKQVGNNETLLPCRTRKYTLTAAFPFYYLLAPMRASTPVGNELIKEHTLRCAWLVWWAIRDSNP